MKHFLKQMCSKNFEIVHKFGGGGGFPCSINSGGSLRLDPEVAKSCSNVLDSLLHWS